MFQVIGILGLLGAVLGVMLHAVLGKASERTRTRSPLRRGRLWQAFIGLFLLGLVALAVTGFIAAFGTGAGSLGGWLLWAHTAAAAPFILGLVVVVLWSAERHRLAAPEQTGAHDVNDDEAAARPEACTVSDAVKNALFWAMAVLGLIVILSIAVCMTPLFAAETQHALITIHRISALLLTMVVIVQVYVAWMLRERVGVEQE